MIMDNSTNFNKLDSLENTYFAINVIYLITMLIGFFGNILIVSTILKMKYLRTPMNIGLLSLALCDFIVCACVLPIRLYLYSSTWDAPYMQVLCGVDVFMKSVCDYVQLSMLLATSYERYKSIAKPFQSKAKMKRTVIVNSAFWCTCLCCGIISAILFKDGATIFPCNKNITTVQLSSRVLYYREAYVTFPLGFSCIVLVSIFYFLMIRVLHEHTNKMKKQLKTKHFKNKVQPLSKTEQNVKTETHLDTLIIQPMVVENNDANASDNSRKTSGTSVSTPESLKNSNEIVNTITEQNDQVLQVSDETREDSHTVTTGSNSDCQKVEHISPGSVPRRISIKKTRDNILLPSKENRDMPRFSTIAKHVVILKSHKRRSLNNMQIRLSKNTSANKRRKSSSAGQESNKSKQELVDVNKQNETDIENNVNREMKTELINNTSAIGANSQIDGQVECLESIESKTVIHDTCIPNRLDEIHTEPSNVISNIGNHSENSSETITNVSPNNGENSIAENIKICIPSKSDYENNDKVLQSRNDTKEIGEIDALPGKSDNVTETSDKQNYKNGSTKVKNKISNIDIVDFDGTVHKDVKVEGAVVGAVCVMNTTNRLEGRRKVEMRAAKRIAVMMGSFVLLWLPLPLIALFVSSRRQISTSDIEALLTSASISATTIAFNPILNLLLNKQLRSAAITVLRRAVNALKRIRLH